jgi:stress-induced morphogen
MKLNTSGANDEEIQKVLKELKNCRVDWVDEADENTAMAFISFVKKGDRYEATVNAKSGSGKQKVKEEKMIFKETEGVGKELALRLFAKSGAMMYEKRDAGN